MSEGWVVPPGDAVWLDEDHAYKMLSRDGEPLPIGLIEYHRQPGGEWCMGGVYFRGSGHPSEWDVVSWDPLTLSPSLLCRSCDMHGWIRGGVWVQA